MTLFVIFDVINPSQTPNTLAGSVNSQQAFAANKLTRSIGAAFVSLIEFLCISLLVGRSDAISSAIRSAVRRGLASDWGERSFMPATPSQRATTFAVTLYVRAAWALEQRPCAVTLFERQASQGPCGQFQTSWPLMAFHWAMACSR
ncbi:hypothetical protein HFO27_33735 [Rhizobium leguminosarum]|uniref:hypothetical protein n=1 Tax=Rhizobium leguminosarum TaxID=384 RepID=UPI001C923166|nr:hypothetical protein [Rhizobium leguminosarum]MBY3179485.1 hypothetical protein [Rhizobium leguminosarum]